MKEILKYLFSIIIVSNILFFSCKKEKAEGPSPCPGCSTYYAADVKNWLYFQPGTYWIYEEQTSGDIDCVYVTSNTYDDGNPQSAFFRCETYSTYHAYYFNYLSNNPLIDNCYPSFMGEKRCVIVNRDKTKPGDFVGETVCFFFRPKVGDTYDTWNNPGLSTVSVESIIDSIVVSDSLYEYIVLMDEERNITESDQNTKFYFAENYGIIKKILIDSSQTWNLIRYNIIQ